ncbi:MAG: hypothetical protein JNJ73_18825 [Hyphomonadaceae bacterium]|nr:hypothetical protein [Hyphomonadaceae bacterium]
MADQERKLREEEAKLSAAWINGVSLAFFVVGVLQPIMSQSFSRWSLLLLITSGVLHLAARTVLRRNFPLE